MTLSLRATVPGELDFVLAAEADPDAAPHIIRWSRAEHERALDDPDQAHLIVLDSTRAVGFILLAGLTNRHRAIELRRIVVTAKGRGIGRQALRLAVQHSFARFGAHRIWLDVKVHNERARRAYAAVGFVEEGVLRDAIFSNGLYESLAVMSILEHEWSADPDRRHAATFPRSPPHRDDGCARSLRGGRVPPLRFESTTGHEVDLASAARERLVVYVFPRTGVPGESRAFRDLTGRFSVLGATLFGLSAQPLAEQCEFAARERLPYPLLSDPRLVLAEALGLPTFEIAGMRLYRRLTFVASHGTIDEVFYPSTPAA